MWDLMRCSLNMKPPSNLCSDTWKYWNKKKRTLTAQNKRASITKHIFAHSLTCKKWNGFCAHREAVLVRTIVWCHQGSSHPFNTTLPPLTLCWFWLSTSTRFHPLCLSELLILLSLTPWQFPIHWPTHTHVDYIIWTVKLLFVHMLFRFIIISTMT